jgi:ATP phosphoribosyltransferase regulatory subunit
MRRKKQARDHGMSAASSTYTYTTLRERVADVLKVFETSGYEPILLPIIQPAGLFLDTMGESVRSSTYVFDDHYGHELCLRPDLTVPTCRYYLDANPDISRRVRYSYYGPVFRFHQDGIGLGQPGEIRQTGIECFGEKDVASADAEVLRLTLDALRGAGLKRFDVTIGDVGIFRALLQGIPMPDRWRKQLQHVFFQPAVFERTFKMLHAPKTVREARLPDAVKAAIRGKTGDAAEAALVAHLAATGIQHVGDRGTGEIAARLLDIIEDAEQDPLPVRYAGLIDAYLHVRDVSPPSEARARIADLAKPHGVEIDEALEAYAQRLRMFSKTGVDMTETTFSTAIGRNFEYYTGFVFEVSTVAGGERVVVASGGRYDGLIKAVDGVRDTPAVGAAIYMDRLLSAVRG